MKLRETKRTLLIPKERQLVIIEITEERLTPTIEKEKATKKEIDQDGKIRTTKRKLLNKLRARYFVL